jgi:outer membrane receptor for ferrienterochelin and colicins
MKLPVLGPLDPRSSKSPWWSLQNIQITKSISQKCEVIFGIKNLLNWTPNKRNPFIIARAFDPFDKNVEFDSEGNAIANHKNPYGLTFDPTYAYGPNQGINFRLDLKLNIQ